MKTSNFTYAKVLLFVAVFITGLCSPVASKQQASPFKVLAFYTNYADMGDKAHSAFALEANTWFPTVAAANGFIYESTTDWNKLNAANLANYKVIMFLDNYPGGATQRTAFQNYITNGGGWIGFHVCMFNMDPCCLVNWDWYTKTLVGTEFYKNNTWAPTTAVLAVEDTSYVITKGFPKKFTGPVNEWYAWTGNVKGNANLKVLCSIHTDSYPLGTGTGSGGASEIWQNNGEYRPMIWVNKNYKAMYTNAGHDLVNYGTGVGQSKTFSCALYDTILIRAIKYYAGVTTSLEGSKPVDRNVTSPNPMMTMKTDANSITLTLAGGGTIVAILYDTNGRILREARGIGGSCRLDRSGLSSGVGIVKVTSSSGVASKFSISQ
jgi:hypothetical protein